MGAGGVGASARGAGSAASCDIGLFGRRMRLPPFARRAARFVPPFASISSVGAAGWLWEHLAVELRMLPCSFLCDVIGERSARVASVLSDLFRVSSIPKCEYGTAVV